MQDLYQQQLIVGDTGPGTGTRSYPKVLNDLIGTRFKLVGGFPSSIEVFLAMERGEVEGICESLDSVRNRRPDWIAERQGRDPVPGRPQPQSVAARACRSCSISPATASSGRCWNISMPGRASAGRSWRRPDLPPERLEMLRNAFDATMKDR